LLSNTLLKHNTNEQWKLIKRQFINQFSTLPWIYIYIYILYIYINIFQQQWREERCEGLLISTCYLPTYFVFTFLHLRDSKTLYIRQDFINIFYTYNFEFAPNATAVHSDKIIFKTLNLSSVYWRKEIRHCVLKTTTTKPVYRGSDTTYCGTVSMVTPFSLDPFKCWRVSTMLRSATTQKTANFLCHLKRVIIKKIIREISLACWFWRH
jgi:hypothetical protein